MQPMWVPDQPTPRKGILFLRVLQKNTPCASKRLLRSQAGGSDAVLGTSHRPSHPDFMAKGCRIVVARVGCRSGAGLAPPGVPTSSSLSLSGDHDASRRQTGGKTRFSQGVMAQTGEQPPCPVKNDSKMLAGQPAPRGHGDAKTCGRWRRRGGFREPGFEQDW